MKLTEAARTSALFIVYALAGVTQTIRDTNGEIFRPEAVSIALTEDGEINFVGLVGPKAHFDGISISYSDATARIFTREQIMTEADDFELEVELTLVNEILMAQMRLTTEIVTSIPA